MIFYSLILDQTLSTNFKDGNSFINYKLWKESLINQLFSLFHNFSNKISSFDLLN